MGTTLTWVDSTATSHDFDGLSGNPMELYGTQGLYMPPIALLDQRTPGQPGSKIRYVDLPMRPITIPLLMQADSETDLQTLRREMLDTWFAEPGTLLYTGPDSSQREIACYYAGGLEGDNSTDNRQPGRWKAALQLLAEQPFWTDTSDTTAGPYSNTQMTAGQTIANGGAYLVYPVWTLHGPFAAMVITDTTTGLKMDLTADSGLTLGSSDSLVIDADAGTIILNGTTSEIGHLTTDSVLFPLAAGNNAVTFTYSSGSNGVTTATITFRQRYRGV